MAAGRHRSKAAARVCVDLGWGVGRLRVVRGGGFVFLLGHSRPSAVAPYLQVCIVRSVRFNGV